MECESDYVGYRKHFSNFEIRTTICWSCGFKVAVSNTAWIVSKYGVISGPYFPVLGLNTEIYEVNLHIQSECRKIRTRNNSVFGHFFGHFSRSATKGKSPLYFKFSSKATRFWVSKLCKTPGIPAQFFAYVYRTYLFVHSNWNNSSINRHDNV